MTARDEVYVAPRCRPAPPRLPDAETEPSERPARATALEPFRVHYVRSSTTGYVDVPAGAQLELVGERPGGMLVVSSRRYGLERALVDARRLAVREAA